MNLKPKIKELKEKAIIYIQTKGYKNESIGPIWDKLMKLCGEN